MLVLSPCFLCSLAVSCVSCWLVPLCLGLCIRLSLFSCVLVCVLLTLFSCVLLTVLLCLGLCVLLAVFPVSWSVCPADFVLLCLVVFSCALLTSFPCVVASVLCRLCFPASWPVHLADFMLLCLADFILLSCWLFSCILASVFCWQSYSVSWPVCPFDFVLLCLGLHYITRKTSGRADVTGLTEVSYTQTVCMSYSLNTAATTAQTEHTKCLFWYRTYIRNCYFGKNTDRQIHPPYKTCATYS